MIPSVSWLVSQSWQERDGKLHLYRQLFETPPLLGKAVIPASQPASQPKQEGRKHTRKVWTKDLACFGRRFCLSGKQV
ncbi:unnamed protein product [Calypogeia fissa]